VAADDLDRIARAAELAVLAGDDLLLGRAIDALSLSVSGSWSGSPSTSCPTTRGWTTTRSATVAEPREPHYSVEFEENAEGWWQPSCSCGKALGIFPTAEDACDALMQHSYEQGILDERHGRV
jgi:hypothetical protein